jgi:tetratricopeptide (TPR) repeat protein
MKVAVQQEDLQLLAKTLQEQLLVEVPLAGVFQVKCAVNKDELMILTQHPSGVTVDAETIFAVIEDALQSLAPYREQRVQCFLRVFGEQLPYAKRFLTLKHRTKSNDGDLGIWTSEGIRGIKEDEEEEEVGKDEEAISSFSSFSPSSPSSALTYFPSSDETEEEEVFDPFADAPSLPTSKPTRRIKPIFFGVALVGIVVLGVGGYLLTRPCVMSECKEIQIAQQLKTESPQLIRRAKSEKDLIVVHQRLTDATTALNVIPSWSPRYQTSEELKVSLSGRAEKISQVVKALQTASLAAEKIKAPARTLEEIQARQHLWRQAIAPLEAVTPNNELYPLIQAKLFSYRISLHTINQQIQTEEKWLKKLAAAKDVANTAENRQASAKSLKDWQKVQSNWQVVINALRVIPQTSPAYEEAQKLLLEYKPKLVTARDRTTKEQLAARTYQQAVSTANQAKVYQQQNQWQAAATYWEQALETAKKVSQDSLYYTQAQSLIEPYSTSLKQAQEKLQVVSDLQQTRTDLEKTCVNGIRICTFSMDDAGIIVRLTPEYDQLRQNTSVNPESENSNTAIDLTNHLQVLQEALAVISDNANLSLSLYDSQGQVIYTRTLGG